MLKKITAIVFAILIAPAAYANCRTHTIIGPDGRVIICTVCCYMGGNCTTTCV